MFIKSPIIPEHKPSQMIPRKSDPEIMSEKKQSPIIEKEIQFPPACGPIRN